jgi:hypothetical protein
MFDTLLDAAERIGWGRGTAEDHERLAYAGYETQMYRKNKVGRSYEEEAIIQQDNAQEFALMARIARERLAMGLPHEFSKYAGYAALAASNARIAMQVWEEDQFYA